MRRIIAKLLCFLFVGVSFRNGVLQRRSPWIVPLAYVLMNMHQYVVRTDKHTSTHAFSHMPPTAMTLCSQWSMPVDAGRKVRVLLPQPF